MSIEFLEANYQKLPAESHGFAKSLCATAKTRQLSDKQAYWVKKLTDQIKNPPTPIGALNGILDLFEAAEQHLKYPKVILGFEANSNRYLFRLGLAGPNSKFPGSINVTRHKKDEFGNRDWYGRIKLNGVYEPGMKHTPPEPAKFINLLKSFAEDPISVAQEYGKLTGNCCFCNQTLTDERSTEVGYGPICANHFNLTWG